MQLDRYTSDSFVASYLFATIVLNVYRHIPEYHSLYKTGSGIIDLFNYSSRCRCQRLYFSI